MTNFIPLDLNYFSGILFKCSIIYFLPIILLMYLTTILSLLVLASSLNCPISPQNQCTAFSGLLSAEPDVGVLDQNMRYTNNYQEIVSQIPQVCLSISGYEDSNVGFMKIQINTQSITQQSFVVHVSSPSSSKWKKLGINYLVSTKSEIQMGIISNNQPIYDNNGCISLQYTPTIKITNSIKIRQFIVGVDISAQNGAALALNFEKYQIQYSTINFLFSSASCQIRGLTVSVVIFDPNTPGLLFVDGSISQNSLSTVTEVQVQKTYIEQLRIYFVGFNSLFARDSNGLTISVSFSKKFSLLIDSTHIKSIQVNYLVISFIECGSCTGYPYSYNSACYAQCPRNTVLSNGACVPINCGNGYQLNHKQQCIPICGQNQQYTGKSCSCISGYNMINGQCTKCPPGTSFNYIAHTCQSICGPNANFNQNDQRCYCENGYVVVNKVCTVCPQGTQYNPSTGQCQQCPLYSTLVSGFCQCRPGYILANNICIPNCQNNQILVNNVCQCQNGWSRNPLGQCVPMGCADGEYFSNGICVCVVGYTRQQNGRCFPIQCQPGFILDRNLGQCLPRCSGNTYWDDNNQICIPQCAPGTVYNVNFRTCVPVCQTNFQWNGNQCVCVSNCQPVCPPGTYYDQISRNCIGQCSAGQRWDSDSGRCIPLCGLDRIWDGNSCLCRNGLQLINGICQVPIPSCQNGKIWNGRECVCPPGLIETFNSCRRPCPRGQINLPNGQCGCQNGHQMNNYGACIPINECPNGLVDEYGNCQQGRCGLGEQWSGFNCVCKPNHERIDPRTCLPQCSNNQQRRGRRCQCRSGFQRNPSGVCQPNNRCPPPHRWVNNNCVCAQGFQNGSDGNCIQICQKGYIRNGLGHCVIRCNNDQILANGQCVCRVGLHNVNGRCQQCPEFSRQVNGRCICIANNSPANPGSTCPTPGPNRPNPPNQQCPDPNSFWDHASQCCKCSKPGAIWSFGGCQIHQDCGDNQIWTGYACVCKQRHRRVNNRCQINNQNVHCPPNSSFNGVNCRCNDGFFSSNGQCIRCPPGSFWNGNRCVQQRGSCINGFQWDNRRNCCNYQKTCDQNQQWDGANCRCIQGFFYINGRCSQCPSGTVFDGKQCNRGYPNSVCRDPYSYFNGHTCVCIPGYWQLAGGCVTCPPTHEWNGICCSLRTGISRAITDGAQGNTVPAILR